MKRLSLKKRYDAFCADAADLLDKSGLEAQSGRPSITGEAFYDACVQLATLHFPEDKEVSGTGPRGLLWSMYSSVGDPKERDPVAGAKAIAVVLRSIINNRPPLDMGNSSDSSPDAGIQSCPFFEQGRQYRTANNLIFVLMPFREPWSDRIWGHLADHLDGRVSGKPLIVRRADEMFGQGVMEDVLEGIITARLIIAECTGRNPNVLYELGLAHALGKRTALLSQNEEDIPFDLRRFRFCIYEDNSSGYPALKRFLQQTAREVFGGVEF